jgi:hypothetical protein
MKPNFIVCIPVKASPNWTTTYSTYKKIPCPDCQELMWIGERQAKMLALGEVPATCMFCLITKHGISPEEIEFVKLADMDNPNA